MHQREKVIRTIKGEEQIVDFVFGSGVLIANPPEIKVIKGYKLMRAFGFSIKFSNGRDKKPTYYALEIWGNNAEHMARLGFKGQLIEVAGRMRVEKYRNQQDEDKELNVLTVERFTCLTRKTPSSLSGVPFIDDDKTVNVELETEMDDMPVRITGELEEYDDLPF